MLAAFAHIFRAGLAGVIAGALFLGIGARLVMRLLAAVNPEARGLTTDNGNTIGDITASGTVELVVFIGIAGGAIAGIIWIATREFLPAGSRMRLLLGTVIATSFGGSVLIQEDNLDFFLLDPAEASIPLFLALMALCGGTTILLDRFLEPILPTGDTVNAIYGGLSGLAGIFALPTLFGSLFLEDGCGCSNPPWPTGVLLLALIGLAGVSLWRHFSGGTGARENNRLTLAGRAALAGVFLVSTIDLGTAVNEIL